MSDRCGACGATLEPSEAIHVAGEGLRCYRCFNRAIAERIGLDYDAPQFQPVVLEDADGAPHTFLIRSILVPTGHELEAVEKTDEDRPATVANGQSLSRLTVPPNAPRFDSSSI